MRKLLFVIMLVIMSSDGSFAASKSEIVFNLVTDPRTVDPVLNNAVDGNNVILNIFEGLVRTGFDDSPEPACSESWEVSPDGLTWTFHLRDNLKWSDGKALTASQFRDGFLRAMSPETASPLVHYTFFIKNAERFYNSEVKADEVGLSAPDDKTLIIELEQPNPLMLDYLSFTMFMPARDFMKDPSWAAKPETLISNGPFKLESWKHGDGGEIILVKNHDYWEADRVKVDRLRFVLIHDSNTAVSAFKAGKVDYMTSIPAPLLPVLLKTGEAKSRTEIGTMFAFFNTARGPFTDSRVRRALSLAIDRKAIVDKVLFGGGAKPAEGLVAYLVPGTTDLQDFRTEGGAFFAEHADIDEARKLLAEAGYPNGKNFPKVTLKYPSGHGYKSICEALQGMWKKALGIEIDLQNEEWKVYLETEMRKDYDIAVFTWLMDFFDASGILDIFTTKSPQNSMSYSNPEFDDLMNKAAHEMDRAKRINYMHEAEKILMIDSPVMPIYFCSSAFMQSRRVKNIYHSPRDFVLFRSAELE